MNYFMAIPLVIAPFIFIGFILYVIYEVIKEELWGLLMFLILGFWAIGSLIYFVYYYPNGV